MFYENNLISLERAILATYVYLDFYTDIKNPTQLPKLNKDMFQVSLHKRIAGRLNKAIDDGESLSTVGFEMQDKIAGSSWESEWLEILASNVLPTKSLDSYTSVLRVKAVERKLHAN